MNNIKIIYGLKGKAWYAEIEEDSATFGRLADRLTALADALEAI